MAKFFWTPHSGYHWDGSDRRFFEGWYLRLTLPASGDSFAFMYSIDDPAGRSPLSGGAAQILGPGEQYLYCPLPQVDGFWAWRSRLGLGHWGEFSPSALSPRQVSAPVFDQTVQQGYQVTAHHHQGRLTDAETGAIARWDYTVEPVYGWGQPDGPPLATAGWLSYLPILEPGWQVLMAHGLATGWAEWQGQRYEFVRAPAYAEKNWGGAFPQRWFWLQANAFPTAPDLALTAAGGRRQVLGQTETVGLIGLHWQGQFLALNSLHHQLRWHVTPWGTWQLVADHPRYRVVVQGRATQAPAIVRVPTAAGLRFECWDTTHGELAVEIWERSPAALTLHLRATTHLAGLEVGGQGWAHPWTFATAR
ncbi:MAG TPA: tocopherol cyclase family protein [Candidatus Obscuribacterales bacterium]